MKPMSTGCPSGVSTVVAWPPRVGSLSNRRTRCPALCSSYAAVRPPMPAPTTATLRGEGLVTPAVRGQRCPRIGCDGFLVGRVDRGRSGRSCRPAARTTKLGPDPALSFPDPPVGRHKQPRSPRYSHPAATLPPAQEPPLAGAHLRRSAVVRATTRRHAPHHEANLCPRGHGRGRAPRRVRRTGEPHATRGGGADPVAARPVDAHARVAVRIG